MQPEPKSLKDSDKLIAACKSKLNKLDEDIIAAHTSEDHETGDNLRKDRYLAQRDLNALMQHKAIFRRESESA